MTSTQEGFLPVIDPLISITLDLMEGMLPPRKTELLLYSWKGQSSDTFLDYLENIRSKARVSMTL